MPALIREQLQACLVKNVAVKRYRGQQLGKALAFLQGLDLAVMLLKGAVLDVLVYTQPWYTMSDDVDLLLRCRWEALGAEDRAAIERERGSRPKPLVLQSWSPGCRPRQGAGPGDEPGKGGDCENALKLVRG